MNARAPELEPTPVVSGEYIECARMKARMSREACTINREGKGKLKRKETCMGCDGPGDQQVDINRSLVEEPAVKRVGADRLPRIHWVRALPLPSQARKHVDKLPL